MNIFKLPDLGEGLSEAVIREWHVKKGDKVTVDDPLVSVETAKALVDVPSPYDGVIEELCAEEGESMNVGEPLVKFSGEPPQLKQDSGTVVGVLEEDNIVMDNVHTVPTAIAQPQQVGQAATTPKVLPAVRNLAKQLGVDLKTITPIGDRITAEDVKQAAQSALKLSDKNETVSFGGYINDTQLQPLSMARRSMAQHMSESHRQVVPVTLVDDVDIVSWSSGEDITLRLLRAIQAACEVEPILNAYFDPSRMSFQKNDHINVGLAVDTGESLYTPVIKHIADLSDSTIREKINQYKVEAKEKRILQADLQGATILLSNFGIFAGRYANPIIIPPMVAIIGVGRLHHELVAPDGEGGDRMIEVQKLEKHPMLPLSLTVDHRLITGGEAARFLKALMQSLSFG